MNRGLESNLNQTEDIRQVPYHLRKKEVVNPRREKVVNLTIGPWDIRVKRMIS